MKVLLYSRAFEPSAGGVQTIVLELALGLASLQPNGSAAEAIDVTVVTKTPGETERDGTQFFQIVRSPGIWKFLRLLHDADVVHLAGPALMPLSLALLLRKPIVLEHHGFQSACPNGLLFFEPTKTPCPGHFMAKRYTKCVECNQGRVGFVKSLQGLALTHVRRWLANRVAFNITPTDWLATILVLKRMKTVYHGISPGPAKAPGNLSNDKFAFQGRLVSTKGVGLLLQAAHGLQQARYKFHLKIIGDGPEQESLKSQAAGLDGRVAFLGHVPEANVGDVLSDVATVVMPSLGGEVFGLVAAENMLRGKLLIVSDIGALREVVGDTGMVFRTGDDEGLALCMRKVMDNPSLAAPLGAAARQRAMKVFDRNSMIQRHVSLYREALRR
jgi:glycosyltransferase involved in cell wall biosynthesis